MLLFHTLPLAVYTWLGPPDISEREKGCNRPLLELLAAPDPSSIEQLNADFRDLEEEGRYWGQIRNAKQITKSEKIDESFDWDRMTVPDDLRRRIETEVLGFFTEESKLAHRRLRVPYRRGVLLWGPPGNGKTTMMRLLAAKLEDARMLLLPRSKLQDDQDIEAAMAFAKSHTPAVLLLEDIDSMFQSMVTMSRFLNLLDGLDVSHGDCASDGGLLVVATTNHPDKLDPAINSRPGRFDTLIEFPLPDAVQRRRYLAGGAEAVPASMRETLVGQTRGMSYVHLRELFKLANLYALNRNSPERDETDLMAALETLRSDFQAGCQGFQGQAEAGFGFATR
ncbi:MAG: AAA family ATPase [Planctomycetota bacterium]